MRSMLIILFLINILNYSFIATLYWNAVAKKVENLVGHKLPGQVMRAGHRLLSYSMDEVPTAVGA